MSDPKQQPQQGKAPEQQGKAKSEPLRFAALKGCPRKKTLEHSQTVTAMVNGQAQNQTIPGAIMRTQAYQPDPGIRQIVVETMPECRRADNRYKPEEVSKLIQQTPEFENGLILTWEEYEARQRLYQELAEEKSRKERELEQQLAAKRGKRGAEAAAV